MHCLIFCHTWLWWQWIWARKFESRHILIFEHVGSHCPQFSWYLNNWFCPYIWIFGYLLPTFFLGIWMFWSVDTPATLSYRIQFTSAEKIHVYLYVISHSWHLLWRTFVFWHGCKLTSFWLFCVDKCCNWKLRLSERQLFQQQKRSQGAHVWKVSPSSVSQQHCCVKRSFSYASAHIWARTCLLCQGIISHQSISNLYLPKIWQQFDRSLVNSCTPLGGMEIALALH